MIHVASSVWIDIKNNRRLRTEKHGLIGITLGLRAAQRLMGLLGAVTSTALTPCLIQPSCAWKRMQRATPTLWHPRQAYYSNSFLRRRSHGNCQALSRTTLTIDTPCCQDDTGRGAGPCLGAPAPLTLGVHYPHTGRGAGPTPRAAPRSFTHPGCLAASRLV